MRELWICREPTGELVVHELENECCGRFEWYAFGVDCRIASHRESEPVKFIPLVRLDLEAIVAAEAGTGAEPPPCPGTDQCHGPQVWCDRCGDTSTICDMANCDAHPTQPVLP